MYRNLKFNVHFIICLLCCGFQLDAQVNWDVYHDVEAGFEILSPCALLKSVDTFNLVNGTRILTRHNGVYMGSEDTLWFDISHWHLDTELSTIPAEDVRIMMDSSIHELETIIGAPTLYRDYSSRFGHPSVLFKIRFPDRDASFKHLMLRGNGRYYLARVYASRSGQSKPAINRFLDSFRLID